MALIKKQDVNDIEKLQIYLESMTKSGDRIYHYTTYESLLQIIEEHCFRLTNISLLNDKAELKLAKFDNKRKYYSMSFTGGNEYVSMWAMYGRSSGVKLRLDISKKNFINAINKNFYYDKGKKDKIEIVNDLNKNKTKCILENNAIFSDIVYLVKESNELRHKERSFENIKANEELIRKMAGFIKYSVWEFEREKRLLLRLENSEEMEHDKASANYIYAGINDELISDFHITFNPWMSKVLKDQISKSLNDISGRSLSYVDSSCDDEVNEMNLGI